MPAGEEISIGAGGAVEELTKNHVLFLHQNPVKLFFTLA
jgi:hypothetical protein